MNGLIMIFKLSPIFLLCALVMNGFDTLMAAPISLFYAAIVCWLTTKRKVMDILDSALGGVKDAMMVFFIFMLAYGVAAFFMSTGVGASVILIAIKLGVSGRSVAVVAFIVSCILSMSTGTSWGTYAATIPIFMWLGHIVGGDPVMTMCACAGGAAFGDNVALISDTTIMTCAIQKVEVVDRFNKQLVWSLSNVALAAILFYATGFAKGLTSASADAANAISEIPADAWATLQEERPAAVELLTQVQDGNIPVWMILPVVLIIAMAVMHFPTLVCLATGIISAAVLGAFIGTISSFSEFTQMMYDSFADAGSWILIMVMWIIFFGGVMREMGAFEPLMGISFRHSAGFGKRMEYNLVGKMLMEGLDVYLPLVDDHGVDCVIKKDDGTFIEVQIKARSNEVTDGDAALFSAITHDLTDNFYFVFYSERLEMMWILSSEEFLQECVTNKTGKNAGKRSIWFNGNRKDKKTGIKKEYCKKQFEKYIATDFSRFH